MSGDLLFVPAGPSSKRQKELAYAECKAHLAKIAHRRRRQTKSAPRVSAECLADHDITRSIRQRHLLAKHQDKNDESSTLQEVRKHRDPLPHPISPSSHRNPAFFPKNDLLGNPAIASSAQVMRTIRFAQFHLAKSCYPPFMQWMTGISAVAADNSAERATHVSTTRWMWDLWVSDTGLFWAILASVVPLMLRHASGRELTRLEHMAMQLKAHSLKDLQRSLDQINSSSISHLPTAVYHVKALFREACASGDTNAATHHARMVEQLAGMLLGQKDSKGVTYSQLALWSDALPALLQMRRPIVQYSSWMTPVIEAIWEDAEQVLPNVTCENVNSRICQCVHEPAIREAFTHLHRALKLINSGGWWLAARSEDGNHDVLSAPQADLIFRWMTTKAEDYICQLLYFYLDTVDSQPSYSTSNSSFPTSLTQTDTYVSVYMELSFALALLYLYQKIFFVMPSPEGIEIDIHESASTLYPLFRRAVQNAQLRCCTCSSTTEQSPHEEVLLWFEAIGVEMERNVNHTTGKNNNIQRQCPSLLPPQLQSQLEVVNLWQRGMWPHSQLPTHISACGLRLWTDTRGNIFNRFV